MKHQLIGVLCLVSLLAVGCSDPEADAQYNEALGNRIVKAIGAYEVANGSLPPSLESIAPRYIASIPKPSNARWVYENRADHFLLGFRGGESDAVGWYDSRVKYWTVDTK